MSEPYFWPHEKDRRAPRAQTAPFSRRDLGGWAARVTGPDAVYGLRREFLQKTYPIAWEKRPALAFDCAPLQPGDILQMHGYESRSTQVDLFYKVVENTDEGLFLTTLSAAEVLAEVRGKAL